MSGILRVFKIHEYSIYIKCGNSVFIFQEMFSARLQEKKKKDYLRNTALNIPVLLWRDHLFYPRFQQFIEMAKKIKESFRCK